MSEEIQDEKHIEYYQIILRRWIRGSNLKCKDCAKLPSNGMKIDPICYCCDEQFLLGTFRSSPDADAKQEEIYRKIEEKCKTSCDSIEYFSRAVSFPNAPKKFLRIKHHDQWSFVEKKSNVSSAYSVVGHKKAEYWGLVPERTLFFYVVEKHTIKEPITCLENEKILDLVLEMK